MIEPNIYDYFILGKNMREFLIESDIMLESNISNVCFHKYMKIKTNSDNNLLLEKALNVHTHNHY